VGVADASSAECELSRSQSLQRQARPIAPWSSFANPSHFARLDRTHDRSTRIQVRQQILKAVRSGADNQNRDTAAGQILLVLEALIHRQKQIKADGFGQRKQESILLAG
jgi:hypothetical protein